MTLSINSTTIQVKNAQGQIKFTSDNKLVYLRYTQQGNIALTGSFEQVIPFYPLEEKEFFMLRLKINSCSGNAIDPTLYGKWFPANGSIVTNLRAYGAGAQGEPGVETCILAPAPNGRSGISFTQYMGGIGTGGSGSTYFTQSPITLNVDYDARIYSYL